MGKIRLVLGTAFFICTSAFAQLVDPGFLKEFRDTDYARIKTVTIRKVGETFVERFGVGRKSKPNLKLEDSDELGEVIEIIDKMITIGEKVYSIVKKGRPVLDIDVPSYHVLPNDKRPEDVFYEMGGWRTPFKHVYEIEFKNILNITVMRLRWGISYLFNGKYKGGKYLQQVRIVPLYTRVLWGFSLSARVKYRGMFNVGTREKPVAALMLDFQYTGESDFVKDVTTRSYLIRADSPQIRQIR